MHKLQVVIDSNIEYVGNTAESIRSVLAGVQALTVLIFLCREEIGSAAAEVGKEAARRAVCGP